MAFDKTSQVTLYLISKMTFGQEFVATNQKNYLSSENQFKPKLNFGGNYPSYIVAPLLIMVLSIFFFVSFVSAGMHDWKQFQGKYSMNSLCFGIVFLFDGYAGQMESYLISEPLVVS